MNSISRCFFNIKKVKLYGALTNYDLVYDYDWSLIYTEYVLYYNITYDLCKKLVKFCLFS